MAEGAAEQNPSLNESLSSKIECPVCCDLFRSPKCLTCGHSICADCCGKLIPPLANTIMCPVCRRVTPIPSGGLPTNFALQDVIQHYQTGDCVKHYQCVECHRWCTAEEAWIVDTKSNGDMLPRCFRCVIMKHSNSGSASALPTSLESVADMFKRYENDFARLRSMVETSSTEHREWSTNAQQAAALLINRAEDIVQVSRSLAKVTKEDVDELNKEFETIEGKARSMMVPQGLEDLQQFKQVMLDIKSKLEIISDCRRRATDKTSVALNSLAMGLECLLNAAEDGGENESIDETASTVAAPIVAATASDGLGGSSSDIPASSQMNIFSIPASHSRYRKCLVAGRRGTCNNRPSTSRP